MPPDLVEFGRCDVTRPRKMHGDDVLDTAWPRGHHHDAIAQQNRFFDIMGDEYRRSPIGTPHPQELLLHDAARLRIERGERLVHQQDFRIVDKHARERNPLSHTAR